MRGGWGVADQATYYGGPPSARASRVDLVVVPTCPDPWFA
jgi:hypothetical protein